MWCIVAHNAGTVSTFSDSRAHRDGREARKRFLFVRHYVRRVYNRCVIGQTDEIPICSLRRDVQSTARSSVETPSFLPPHPITGFGRDWLRYTESAAFRCFNSSLLSGKSLRCVTINLWSPLFRSIPDLWFVCMNLCMRVYLYLHMCI